MSLAAEKTQVYIGPTGDAVVDASGHMVEDTSIASRVTVRIRARRGEYHLDRNFGSRLHTRKTVSEVQQHLLSDCTEAVQPLIDAGEILRLEQGVMETTPMGGVFAQLVIYVSEGEVVRISGLPLLGATR